jgi:plastocyanin
VNYPKLTILPLPSASNGSETVTLSSSVPAGLALTFSPSSVDLPPNVLSPGITVTMTINSSQTATPGAYKVTVVAKYGTSMATYNLKVNVAEYLVLEQNFAFHPDNLTVKQGSTVYWINMDTSALMDIENSEIHNVVFSSGLPAKSQAMGTYDSYGYTFTTPGTYSYSSTFNPGMTGTITVTA